jgi:DNA-directed RNA polymerase specialized sigma24 family protein
MASFRPRGPGVAIDSRAMTAETYVTLGSAYATWLHSVESAATDVLNVARRIVRGHRFRSPAGDLDSDDVASIAAMRVLKAFESGPPKAPLVPLSAWMLGVTRRVASEGRRRVDRRKLSQERLVRVPALRATAEALVEEPRARLARLTTTQQQAVALLLRGHGTAHVARLLNRSRSAIRERQVRAVRRLAGQASHHSCGGRMDLPALEREEIERLPEAWRPVYLGWRAGKTRREIAREVGTTIASVRSRLQRLRRAIRKSPGYSPIPPPA